MVSGQPDGNTICHNAEASFNNSDNSDCNNAIGFKICTFNCKGFKQSTEYISQLIDHNNIVCLNETWLWPAELVIIRQNMERTDRKITVFAKSFMNDLSPGYVGRAYGGVAVICKEQPLISYKELDAPSDRLVVVGVYDMSGALIQVVCSVYMPYYKSGSTDQTESFIKTIEALQSIVDQYGAHCSVMILGDINVQLPRQQVLSRLWCKQKGFNSHSNIMYNFMEANNMTVTDFLFHQKVNYTYFCDALGTRTWIDHVLCFDHNRSITSCEIVPLAQDNFSDHLPIVVILFWKYVIMRQYIQHLIINTRSMHQRIGPMMLVITCIKYI
jgi:exonuclease III